MLQENKASNNQNMYDLCLMSYSTLDSLLKLCDDNGVDNVNYYPTTGQVFIYDDSLIVNQNITGITMATKYLEP
jgi:hypothetical protein